MESENKAGKNMVFFSDQWIWLTFVVIGLIMALLELLLGVDTGLDLVFIGSAFILGGLITWPLHFWVWTLVITCVICIIYIALGRRYIHRWTSVKKNRTNVDAIIGKKGVVIKNITRTLDGRVKVGNEEWKARADEDISKGEEIVVMSISGVTLSVEKNKGGR
jgi:inner membrane protein